MKKIISLSLLLTIPFILSGCGVVRTFACINKTSLNLFNWGEYIDPDLITAFEDEHNVCVNLSTFDSNESAITKLKTQSFDLVIPSDYAIEQMVSEDLLQAIDWAKIPSLNKETDLADGLLSILNELEFPLLEYAVPYFWGNVGILYNVDQVSIETLDTLGWNIFKENYEIAFYDSSRDGFMVALKSLGYSMNTSDTLELTSAENWLTDLGGKDNIVFLTDEILDDMLDLTYDLALTYSGDAIYLMSEQAKLSFYVPTSGTNVWVDAFVIPKNAKEVDLAYQFIDFMSTYDSALANTEYVMYSTPRKDVYLDMIDVNSAYYDYKTAYEVIIHNQDEVFRYNSITKAFIVDAWARIRAL